MHRLTLLFKGFSKKRGFKGAILLFALAVFLTVTVLLLPKDKKALPGAEYGEIITECSEKHGLDRSLVYAVIECESSFDEKAVSVAGASGLMQLMPETFDWILPKKEGAEERNIFSPRQNIEAGCKYLSYLIKRFGVTETALAAYNAGEGTVSSWLQNPEYSDDGKTLKEIPYLETKLYVSKVMRRAEEYKKALN